jgi:hypothetical protein
MDSPWRAKRGGNPHHLRDSGNDPFCNVGVQSKKGKNRVVAPLFSFQEERKK